MNIKVESYSGYKADEYPLRFYIDDQKYEIMEIEDQWYGPDYSYFKVFADDSGHYILKKFLRKDNWEIEKVRSQTK